MQEDVTKENLENMDKENKKKSNDNKKIEAKQVEESSFENEIQKLKDENEKLKEESDKNYQNYLIAMADKENFRKRYEKEKNEAIQFSHQKLFKELLPVLDSMEKALSESLDKSVSESSTLSEGFSLVEKKLRSILETNGLEVVCADEGVEFDPHIHQAIQKEESDNTEKSIIKEEFMKGYKLYTHLLRPSIVSVFIPKEESSEK